MQSEERWALCNVPASASSNILPNDTVHVKGWAYSVGGPWASQDWQQQGDLGEDQVMGHA